MNKSKICTIYIVRHGQSIANSQDTYGLDTGLTKKGMEQTNELSYSLKNLSFDRIYSSPLVRAKQTAKIISEPRKQSIQVVKDLRERHYGSLEGKTGTWAKNTYKDLFLQRSTLSFQQRLKFTFSQDYESDSQVMDRVPKAVIKIASRNIGKTILLVSHATAMKSILWYLDYASHNDLEGAAFENLGYIKLRYDGNRLQIDSFVGRKKPERLI